MNDACVCDDHSLGTVYATPQVVLEGVSAATPCAETGMPGAAARATASERTVDRTLFTIDLRE
jgi:hypothetical protein